MKAYEIGLAQLFS